MISPRDKPGIRFWELPDHIDEQPAQAQVPLPEAVDAIERQTDPINLAA